MSAAPTDDRILVVDERTAPQAAALLERPPPGGDRVDAVLRHQQILDALDRHEYRRVVVWPDDEPVAVAHLASTGTLVVAGGQEAGRSLGSYLAGSGWRVLLGDAGLAEAVLAATPKGLRRRGISAREQRFMSLRDPAPIPEPGGFRLAGQSDLEAVTEMACRLHVEDRMGPPLSRVARTGVAQRMRSSIARSLTWVVDAEGVGPIAKVDVSLWSRTRGAQIAGVYVYEGWRGRGLATGAVAAVGRRLVASGLPGVTLHVRADNAPGRGAYHRAGFADQGPWLLALR